MRFPQHIYAMEHQATKRMYIGRSNNPNSRLRNHLCLLKTGKHKNKLMQEDYDKYGDDYKFYILEKIEKFEDRFLEVDYQKKYKTQDSKYGYNHKDNAKVGCIKFEDGLPAER